MRTGALAEAPEKGVATTIRSLLKVRAKYVELLKIRKTETDKRDVRLAIRNLDEALKDLRRPGRPTRLLRELDKLTDRERVLAQLARQQAKGADVLFHGTRHMSAVLRSGKLIPPKIGEQAIFFTRSAETAAYWALLVGFDWEKRSAGILVLDRRTLSHNYRIRPSRYDLTSERDEREESLWGRIIDFRKHLLGVVSEADVARVLGPPRVRYLPASFESWSTKKRTAFFKPSYDAGDELVRVGREQIRDRIAKGRQDARIGDPTDGDF
jgi:hypothetical protein